MRYYPLFIDLQNKDVLLVGAGTVGRRKLETLVTTPARQIVIVDPGGLAPGYLDSLRASTEDEQAGLARTMPEISVCKRAFATEDLEGKSLVFAATGDPALNKEIARLCGEKNILCNCATTPGSGDFFVPAICSLDDLTVALGTGGKSPALARKLRKDLEAWLGNRYTPLLRVLGRLRPMLLAQGLSPDQNARILRSLVESPLASRLEHNEREKSRELLAQLLPDSLHASIDELLHEL